jgi:hypothetical protein
MRKQSLLYLTPFVLTAYPVLHMLSTNVELVDFVDITPSFIGYESGTLGILLLFRRIYRNGEKAVFLTSVVVVVFFTYGPVFALIDAPWGHWLLIPLSIVVVGLSARITSRQLLLLPKLIRYMGTTGGFLVLFAMIPITYYSVKVTIAQGFSLETALGLDPVDMSIVDPELLNYDVPLRIEDLAHSPDIYYIILDEYANSHVLMEMHGFDNSPFLDALRQRGFFVAEDSRANYPATFLSLASSLNMDYLDFLSGYDLDFSVPYQLIDDNRVSGILRNAGYQIVYFPSIYYVTSDMESADIIYRIEREVPLLGLDYSNFDLALLDSTLLGVLLDSSEDYDITDDYRETTLYALDNLRLIPEIEGPTFTFAHLTVPHGPYVFTASDAPAPSDGTVVDGCIVGEGRYLPHAGESSIPAYLEQINFINRAITGVVDDLLANSSVPPIIIIQSDHGHRMQEEPVAEQWGPAEIYQHVFPILNSYYLPGYAGDPIAPDITPVNTFRLIFDYYFGTDLGLLEEHNYYPDRYFSYDFIEVTGGIIREVAPAPGAAD